MVVATRIGIRIAKMAMASSSSSKHILRVATSCSDNLLWLLLDVFFDSLQLAALISGFFLKC
jgi:hypothetical protein